MEIRCVTYNVKGLNSPGKRRTLAQELQRLDTDIAFLQETHLVHEEGIKLDSRGFPIWIYGDSPSKSGYRIVKADEI